METNITNLCVSSFLFCYISIFTSGPPSLKMGDGGYIFRLDDRDKNPRASLPLFCFIHLVPRIVLVSFDANLFIADGGLHLMVTESTASGWRLACVQWMGECEARSQSRGKGPNSASFAASF